MVRPSDQEGEGGGRVLMAHDVGQRLALALYVVEAGQALQVLSERIDGESSAEVTPALFLRLIAPAQRVEQLNAQVHHGWPAGRRADGRSV